MTPAAVASELRQDRYDLGTKIDRAGRRGGPVDFLRRPLDRALKFKSKAQRRE